MSLRREKVAQRIKEEVSKIIHDDIKDPRIGFFTISRVDLTDDLRYAKIYYSILGTAEQKKSAQTGLKSALKYVRKLVGERIKLRYTPEICFKIDESIEYSIHLDEIFDKIEKQRNKKKGNGDD